MQCSQSLCFAEVVCRSFTVSLKEELRAESDT